MADGWIAISRGLTDTRHELHPQATGTPACELGAWVDLIGYAKWKDDGGLKRGQLHGSVRFLAARWNWSKSRVSRFLQKLEAAGRISRGTRTGRKPDVITICNYNTYQDPESGIGTRMTLQQNANEDKEEQEQQPLTTTAAVGEFCERTGATWRLDRTIPEWVREIESTPKYQGVDFAYEIHKCTDWHVGKGRKPKAPDMSIRNWLERAAEREQARNGGSTYHDPSRGRL